MRITTFVYRALVYGLTLYASATVAAPAGCTEHTNQATNRYDPYLPNHYEITNWINWTTEVAVPISAKPNDVLLTLTAPVGPDIEALSNDQKTAAAYIALANCPAGLTEIFQPTGSVLPGDSSVFIHSGAPNIGVRTYYPSRSGEGEAGVVTHTSQGQYNLLFVPYGQAKIEFILLNQNWSNNTHQLSFPGRKVASTTVSGWGEDVLLRYFVPGPITFVPEPCHFVTNTIMNVALDPVDATRFTAANMKIEGKTFSLRMQCNANRPAPKVTFRATADSSNRPGVLKNIETVNPAQGVSVLLEHVTPSGATTPVNLSGTSALTDFGLAKTCGDNCSEWSLDLEASYYSTTNTISPGLIRGRVEVTVEHM